MYALALAGVLIATSIPCNALAQWETNRATARNLAAEGSIALKNGDFVTAEDRFRRADTLVHAPTLVVDHARALIGLRLFVEAQERLELVLREGVADSASRVWKRAVQDAHQLVESVRLRVGWLTIGVTGPREPLVTVDGHQVPAAALGIRRATNPGIRQVIASATGYTSKGIALWIPEGGERAITIDMSRSDVAPIGQVAALPTTEFPKAKIQTSSLPKKRSSNAIGYLLLGLGSTSLAVGTVTGALFLSKHSDLASRCPAPKNCQEPALIDDYNRYGTIAAASLGFGLAASTTGILVLLTRKPADDSVTVRQNAAVMPYVSFGRLGLAGKF